MMPQCNKNGCNKVAKVYLGKVIKSLKEHEEQWKTVRKYEMGEM